MEDGINAPLMMLKFNVKMMRVQLQLVLVQESFGQSRRVQVEMSHNITCFGNFCLCGYNMVTLLLQVMHRETLGSVVPAIDGETLQESGTLYCVPNVVSCSCSSIDTLLLVTTLLNNLWLMHVVLFVTTSCLVHLAHLLSC